MIVRPAELTDLNACLALEHSCVTNYVWHMEESEGVGEVTVVFRTARLPRSMRVRYLRITIICWRSGDATVGQPSRELEGDEVSFPVAQAGHGCQQLGMSFAVNCDLLWLRLSAGPVAQCVEQETTAAPLSTKIVIDSVAGDGKEPGAKGRSLRAIAVDTHQSPLEDLSGDVVCCSGISDAIANVVVDAREVMVIDGGEGSRLGRSPGHQRPFVW